MRSRTVFAIAIPCAISALAGASLRPAPGQTSPGDSALPAAYYDLGVFQLGVGQLKAPALRGAKANAPLRLVVRPARIHTSDLRVDLEIWNPSDRYKHLPSLDPFDYRPEFRDASGAALFPYSAPVGDKVDQPLSEMSMLPPAAHLGLTFLLPDFYRRFKQTRGIECECHCGPVYLRQDQREESRNRIELSSGWVAIPPD